MKKVSVDIDGQMRSAFVEKVGDQLWAQIDGRTFNYSPSRRASGQSEAATDPTKIISPMPGKITKVSISEGDAVTENQALIVMEAMKMEYTLSSQINGKVEKLRVKIGDQVDLGALLVELGEENA